MPLMTRIAGIPIYLVDEPRPERNMHRIVEVISSEYTSIHPNSVKHWMAAMAAGDYTRLEWWAVQDFYNDQGYSIPDRSIYATVEDFADELDLMFEGSNNENWRDRDRRAGLSIKKVAEYNGNSRYF